MADLTTVTLTPARNSRQSNYQMHKRRADDLLSQIERLKLLLADTDPDVVLRASQEIRDCHEEINEICKVQASTLPDSIRKRRKRIPKSERKPKKSIVPEDENIFRPT